MIIDVLKIPFDFFKSKEFPGEEQRESIFTSSTEKTREQQENMKLLDECRGWWDSMADFRRRRRRNRRYHRGLQWSDATQDPRDNNKWITEEEYIKQQGKIPLKQNIIRQMMKNLIGQFRQNRTKSVVLSRSKAGEEGAELLSNAIMHVHDLNYINELDARGVEEFALSGMIIQKQGYKFFKTRDEEDIKINIINPTRFFFNTDIQDVRGDDIRLIGEIIDIPIDELVSLFAKTPEDESRIRGLYKNLQSPENHHDGLNSRRLDNLNFYHCEDTSKARVYEVWSLKSQWRTKIHDYADGSYEITNLTIAEINTLNQERVDFGTRNGAERKNIPLIEAAPIKEQIWQVKYITPFGETLLQMESPYEHQEHPYVMYAHPLIDGEVWGFVEDIIDQQRYVNRMIIMMDFILSASSKGVLMIPEDVIPTGMTPEQFAEEWRSFNGVMVYRPSKNHQKGPEQIVSNSTVVGLADMLKFQLGFISDISGIHGAIQGKEPRAGTPASLYAQEASNSSINTLDFFMGMNFFQQKRDEKTLKLILQYYKEERFFAIEGGKDIESKIYDPGKIKGKLYDLKVTQSIDTPVHRHLINETLMQLLQAQMIDVETYLENSTMPYSNSILESIRKRKKEMATEGVPNMEAMNQEIPTDPKAQELLQQAIRGGG